VWAIISSNQTKLLTIYSSCWLWVVFFEVRSELSEVLHLKKLRWLLGGKHNIVLFILHCEPSSSASMVSDYGLDDKIRSQTEAEDFSSSLSVQTGVMLTTHPLLMPRLRKSRSYTSSPSKRHPWHVAGHFAFLPFHTHPEKAGSFPETWRGQGACRGYKAFPTSYLQKHQYTTHRSSEFFQSTKKNLFIRRLLRELWQLYS
jgi:hypothetical protein